MGGDPEGIDLRSPVPWSDVGQLIRARAAAHAGPPFVIGIGGPVSVGKSTLAAVLRADLDGTSGKGTVEVLGTDAFLFPNAELHARDLSLRKGFPESYDTALLEQTLDALRSGLDVSVPVYSHETYDIVPGAVRVVRCPAVLILEGVNALWFHDRLDYGIYVDAPMAAIEGWYVARLVELVADAPAGSFYAGWSDLTDAQVDALAHDIWRTINAVNLTECIEPTRGFADLVVEKGPDHALVALRTPTPEV